MVIMIRANICIGHAFRFKSAESVQQKCFAQTPPLVIRVGPHWLKMSKLIKVVRPNNAVGSYSSIRRGDKNFMLWHIDRGLHEPQCPGPVLFERFGGSKCGT